MMTDLSPAANAVWEAFNQDEAGVFVDYGEKLAAALRALTKTTLVDVGNLRGCTCYAITTGDILDVADELEGAND